MECLAHATPWMNPENMMLSEKSQSQGLYIACFHFRETSRIGKFLETESRLMLASGWRRWGRSEGDV